jgi:enoyl-CoA hydratase/carnithine racemase
MESENLQYTTDGNVGYLELDRPDRLNAMSFEMLHDLVNVTAEIAASDVRCLIISGSGTVFSAGFDVEAFQTGLLYETETVTRYEAAELGGRMADAIESLPQVTLAAMHGHVVGGAVVLAAACDLRVADSDTVFSIPEIDLGIPLGWGGIRRLVRDIGPALTKELLLTGRPFTAQEARNAGFLNSVTDPGGAMATAQELAEHIATKSKYVVVTTKRHVAEIVDGDTSRDDALSLIAGLDDPESSRFREAYLARFGDTP